MSSRIAMCNRLLKSPIWHIGTINLQKMLWGFELVALLPLLNCYTQFSIHFSPSEDFKISQVFVAMSCW